MKHIALITAFIVLASCALTESDSLSSQEYSDVIRVRQTYPKVELLVLSDKEKIEEIVDFINTKRDGWSVPLAGPPVGKVYLEFFENEIFLGNFYVGPYFFGRDHGNFWSQSAKEKEIEALGSILGINLLEIISAAE